jgi:predicted amidohydrolase YtcJ
VAVRDGRILGASPEEQGWGDELDERFADKVILPGFVEGHSHAYEGGVWKFPYVGYFDRIAPDGTRFKGLKNIDEVVGRLQAHEKTLAPGASMLAWGFDPIYFGGRRMDLRPRQGLDRPAGRGDPFQLPRRQRQHAGAGQGGHHAHHQRARHRQGRQAASRPASCRKWRPSTWPIVPPA